MMSLFDLCQLNIGNQKSIIKIWHKKQSSRYQLKEEIVVIASSRGDDNDS
jgi:hypothetical protein